MSRDSIIGKSVWVEMDRDKSAVVFSPRKGTVTYRYSKPLEKEDWLVTLEPPPLMLLPFPQRLHNVILQYYDVDEHSLHLTFESGFSYADILRIKRGKKSMNEDIGRDDVARIGSALVYPWPKPEGRELRIVHQGKPKD